MAEDELTEPKSVDLEESASDLIEDDDQTADTEAPSTPSEGVLYSVPVRSGLRIAVIVGLVSLTFFGGLCGLLGYRLFQARQTEQTHDEFLAAARQAAVNLTTIDYERVESDVQRILDSATGAFYDDFKKRSGPFVDLIRKVKSKSVGSVSEAGVESFTPKEGHVLLAVEVKTANAGSTAERPQYWRMRLTVTKQGEDAKVSEVEFVS